MDFRSDNVAGVAPEIMAALARANTGSDTSYGGDAITARLQTQFRAFFETDCIVHPVATGTAANALALSACAPGWGAVYGHHEAHIAADECGAPEFYTGGAKLVGLPGPHAKIDAATLSRALDDAGIGQQHHVQPKAVSISQASERGTLYRPAEIAALAETAHAHGLKLHMDGARFANALVSLNAAPADLTWRAGVDVLSFGATKNGAMAAEAVVFFDAALAEDFLYRRKRGGHLFSKMRFLSAQLDAYLTDDLWRRNATRANALAARLATGLAALPGARLSDPAEANEVFIHLPEAVIAGLLAQGFKFHRWGTEPGAPIRLICAFDGNETRVDALIAAAKALSS